MMPGPIPETPPVCLCSLGRDRHKDGGKCITACGCDWFRRDPKAAAAARSAATGEREPLWAAAERARAAGELKPLPRMPSVRPESDYEMKLPGEAG
jgi:hypothetical protein